MGIEKYKKMMGGGFMHLNNEHKLTKYVKAAG